MDGGNPALARKGALESSEGEVDSHCNCFHLGPLSVQVPLNEEADGHYVLSAASFDLKDASRRLAKAPNRFRGPLGLMR